VILTRRTFVQSSLAASLAVAAESTRAGWLLESHDPIRVAVAGLGPAASEHIALYAALPGVQIVGLTDRSRSRVHAALTQLEELGRFGARVYTSLGKMLSYSGLHAISVPSEDDDAGSSLREILATGLPVLTDVPPREFSHRQFLATRKGLVRMRVADFLYPGALAEISTHWRKLTRYENEPTGQSARLVLERRLSSHQLRAVIVSALQAVFDGHSGDPDCLAAWSKNPDVIGLKRAGTALHIHLPRQTADFDLLEVDLLPRSSGASLLLLSRPDQTMEIPIWRAPDSRSSLRTVMTFLGEACSPLAAPTRLGGPHPVDTAADASLSFAAASVVDRALSLVEPRID
jgi:hypothetical protein